MYTRPWVSVCDKEKPVSTSCVCVPIVCWLFCFALYCIEIVHNNSCVLDDDDDDDDDVCMCAVLCGMCMYNSITFFGMDRWSVANALSGKHERMLTHKHTQCRHLNAAQTQSVSERSNKQLPKGEKTERNKVNSEGQKLKNSSGSNTFNRSK